MESSILALEVKEEGHDVKLTLENQRDSHTFDLPFDPSGRKVQKETHIEVSNSEHRLETTIVSNRQILNKISGCESP
jgi:hypothetical protein